MKFGELGSAVLGGVHIRRIHPGDIYGGPPADYQADRDIKELPDKTGFNL